MDFFQTTGKVSICTVDIFFFSKLVSVLLLV